MEAPRPKNAQNLKESIESFVKLVWILRTNCPWDMKQTNESIAHLTIEEAYEVIDALEQNDDEEFSKELGDILLHIVLHSVMAEQRNAFKLTDVIKKVHEKMIHRHPHIFGDVEVDGEADVVKNWEALKKKEGKKSALDGVPKHLPSLLRAERIQHKAAKVGFDWDEKAQVWEKVKEEIDEFRAEIANADKKKKEEEFGDMLFALVNAARHEGIVPEEALHKANNKFTRRFKSVESESKKLGKELDSMSLEEMDEIWNKVKESEKSQ